MLYLRVATGTKNEKVLRLSDDQLPLSIGRDKSNRLPIDNNAISRYHAVITSENGNYYIEDFNSTNGTYLNGRQILKDRINPGDAIRIANIGISVEAEPTTLHDSFSPLDVSVSVEHGSKLEAVDLSQTIAINNSQRRRSDESVLTSMPALQALYRADQVLRNIQDIQSLLENLLDLIMEVIPASKGYIFLLDRKTGLPVPYVRRPTELIDADIEVVISKEILKTAIEKKEAFLANEALVEERHGSLNNRGIQRVHSAMCVPLITRRKALGIIYVDSTRESDGFSEGDLSLLSAVAMKAGVTVENARLYDDLRGLFYNTVETLIRALQARDPYTSGHSTRVSRYCLLIADKMKFSTKMKHSVYLASMLHDIGKIGISDSVLQRPGKLTEEEWEIIREHPQLGASMIQMLGEMHPIVPLILHHHEAYDGSGYPAGIKGENIPLISRIIAVADTFDAMTSDRPYRERRSKYEAIAELKNYSGRKYDPEIVQIFLGVLEEISSKPVKTKTPVEVLIPV
jgi:HD-GYP domain-containing protein (c-di-GMP phosphodiesterase class II)/pSer/pThr/pTyr-binding forkhead associated (FHA) protein